jgi:hypothetical protein
VGLTQNADISPNKERSTALTFPIYNDSFHALPLARKRGAREIFARLAVFSDLFVGGLDVEGQSATVGPFYPRSHANAGLQLD